MCNLKHLLWFIGRILSTSVLFTHFLKHLLSPSVGWFEEPNVGLPILGSQYLVKYPSGLYNITDGSKEKNGNLKE
jgi:hypothetical protein